MTTPPVNAPELVTIDQIPGYKEAIAKESRTRLLAWFECSKSVCGFEIAPLTLRRYNLLQLYESPLLKDVAPSAAELAQFLLIMHPRFFEMGAVSKWFFLRKCGKVFSPTPKPFWKTTARHEKSEAKKLANAANIVEASIMEIRDALYDSGKSGGGSKSFYNSVVSVCALLARNYGWTEGEILNIPLSRVFQYSRECKEKFSLDAALISGTKFSNPLSNPSERVVMDYCKSVAEASRN